ncbi:MAG: hypothetical protein LBB23_02245 [Rickettsiales bacterium]|nr:hypothetical protein [Rickettsiales bacterium]
MTTTPSAYASLRRDTPSPAKATILRLTSTNHPVRLRFATARHPATIGGELLTTTPSAYASLRRDTPSPAKGTLQPETEVG